ncbi:MAG TPA: ester cyclase [Actinomycetota bacterium]|nr:ester cyclase [Actinomycetota bacterium]
MAQPKQIVIRLIEEVMNGGDLDVIEQLFSPEMATPAKGWIVPFRESFPDAEMKIVELVAEGEKVAGRFRCSGTNLGEWRGKPPTGRRFEDVDEVYFFRVVDGLIVEAWGLEDTIDRLRQLRQDDDQDQEASPGV